MEEIHDAAVRGDVNTLRRLIALGIDKDRRDERGLTPLHWAATNAQVDALQYLIEQGGNVNTANSIGYTPLMVAAHHSFYAVIELLLSAGASVDARTVDEGVTALMIAAEHSHSPGCIHALLDGGADINAQDSDGWTPLMCAGAVGRFKNVRVLVECGANGEISDAAGKTVLDYAREKGHSSVVEYLEARVAKG